MAILSESDSLACKQLCYRYHVWVFFFFKCIKISNIVVPYGSNRPKSLFDLNQDVHNICFVPSIYLSEKYYLISNNFDFSFHRKHVLLSEKGAFFLNVGPGAHILQHTGYIYYWGCADEQYLLPSQTRAMRHSRLVRKKRLFLFI